MELFKVLQIEAAHFLPGVPEDHKCRRIHGHSFRIEVHVVGPVEEPVGWVMDFADLKQAGYLTCAVPRQLGGGGLTFAQVMQEQRRLASHAHATALGINMHLYWNGVAADLWRAGDKSLEWLLTGAVNGDTFTVPMSSTGASRGSRPSWPASPVPASTSCDGSSPTSA